MGLIKVNGIVLRYADYKENDRMLTLLTAELGKLDVAARGCRRPKNRLMAASQPFIFGEYVLYEGKGRYSVDQFQLKEAFYPIRQDVEKLTVGAYMLRSAENAAQRDKDEALFLLLYHALGYLAYGEAAERDILICYAVKLVMQLGYAPTLTSCVKCGRDVRGDKQLWFSAENGGTMCDACSSMAQRTDVYTLEILRRIMLMPIDKMDGVRLSSDVREQLEKLLSEYMASKLGVRFALPERL
jgi:DNA repair protein RecO (recombination protein O)